jgi:hypothetical protein
MLLTAELRYLVVFYNALIFFMSFGKSLHFVSVIDAYNQTNAHANTRSGRCTAHYDQETERCSFRNYIDQGLQLLTKISVAISWVTVIVWLYSGYQHFGVNILPPPPAIRMVVDVSE